MKSLKELMNLEGRVALITGGAGHVGRAMGEALAELGANIVVLDRAEEACQKVAEDFKASYGVEALPLVVDLAQETQVSQAPAQVLEALGRIDILVNNAAYVGTTPLKGWTNSFENQLASTWREAMEVNLTAPFLLTQACAPALRASGHGSVINIGSIRGVVGVDLRMYEGTTMGSSSAYAASKGGLIHLSKYLATILAPEIRVNSISLGGIARQQPEPFPTRYADRTPLRRLGTEEDTKGAIAYLASDLSAYVTGHNLMVDGGWIAW